jgi:hypothetical protein
MMLMMNGWIYIFSTHTHTLDTQTHHAMHCYLPQQFWTRISAEQKFYHDVFSVQMNVTLILSKIEDVSCFVNSLRF